MNLNASKLAVDHVALAFVAETQAERYQMNVLLEKLNKLGADVVEWNDMEGTSGFTVRVRCAASLEVIKK